MRRITQTGPKQNGGGSSTRKLLILSAGVLVSMLTFSPATRAQNGQQALAPDISGVWQLSQFQGGVLFPKGGAPLTPWAEAKFKAANPQTNDPNLACLPEGMPRFMLSIPLPMEIFQVPTRIVIIREGVQLYRQIYLNRQHLKDLDPTYSGDSVGKWEGDTLVVDTIGLKDSTWVDNAGLPHSEAMRVIERIRRTDHDTLVDDVTIEDPMAFTKPITAERVYKLKPGWEIQEFVCTENNKYTYQAK
jgi:hypothetical protein